MGYGSSDNSGNDDDDLPPSHQSRVAKEGHVTGNRRTLGGGGGVAYPRVQNDIDTQIHRLEQEAYSSILRAFKAQSDAITWEKEGLITELRKEFRVSDEEHRELLSTVNADEIIKQIREWRQAGGIYIGVLNDIQSDLLVPSPSASRKRQKASQSTTSLPLRAQSTGLPSQSVAPSMQPSSAAANKGAEGVKSKKSKMGYVLPGGSSVKSMLYPSGGSSGRGQVVNRNASAAAELAPMDPLVGKKVMIRWPVDNNFYEAVISDCDPVQGLHALVYDINTNKETCEWVDLKEFAPEDLLWEVYDPGLHNQFGRSAPELGVKRATGHGGANGAGRGSGVMKYRIKKEISPLQNGIEERNNGDIEILHTETLLKEVEKVFCSAHSDRTEVEKAKKALRDHEQSLIDAIARLAAASDGESDDEKQFSRSESMDRNQGWRNRQYGDNQHGANYDNHRLSGRNGLDGHISRNGSALGYRYADEVDL